MKTTKLTGRLFACLLIIMASLSPASLSAQKLFTLEELNFGGKNYYQFTPQTRYLTWWGDELVRTDRTQLASVNKSTGKEQILVTLDQLIKGTKGDDSYAVTTLTGATLPYPGKPLVLLTNGRKRYLYDFKKQAVVWEQKRDGESVYDFNTVSRAVAYVKDCNLHVTDGEGHSAQLTTDGSRDIVYGQSVHRDEFGIYKGTFWNADGTRLAFYRMDQSMVTDYPLVDIDTRVATLAPEKYPMAGQTSHKVQVGVYDVRNGKTLYLNTGDPTDRYFTNIAWAPDGRTLYLIEINRAQTEYRLDAYDPTTGQKVKTLLTEHHDKYVHPVNPITFLPWDSSKFILQSERDGYNHLYLYNTEGKLLKQLTSGKWVVLDLVGFNHKTRSAIVLSTESSPVQNNVYAVNIANGKRTLLDNGKGCHLNTTDASGKHHAPALSTNGTWLYDKYTEPNVPRNISIVNTANANRTAYFSAPDPWKGYYQPQFTCGTIKAADGVTDLYYRMVKPQDFDPTKTYPTVVYVYGGPGVRNVEARWHWASRSWETYMAEKGYIVFILDNRGSSDRGRDFEQATWHHLGVEEMKDQMQGVAYLKSLPYVDQKRMGVHGWSFGGFMTTSLMTTYPDVFKVGVAGGPVIDWKWYEVMYGERYMGTPENNPDGYAESSVLSKAKNLKGKLQVIIGMNDPVVVPQHALSFLKECIKEGTQPDFFVYPGEPHNMRGHQSTHLHERITQYFEDYLKTIK